MALPAGRYGVTKRQLNKIKNLPVNTIGMIEEAIETSKEYTNDVVGWTGDELATTITPDHSINASGVESENNEFDIIEYMEVIEGDTYVFKGTFEGNVSRTNRIHGYNSSETWVQQIVAQQTTGNVSITLEFTIPSGIKYIRMSLGDSCISYSIKHISVDEQKVDNSVIGTVEDGTNPTKAYAVGEHMIRGGKFCTVTSPVTTSSTWTLNSNYVEGDVASLLYPINVGSITSGDLNDYKTPGVYAIGNKNNVLNTPSGYCTLEVLPNSIYNIGGDNPITQRINKGSEIYTRSYTGNPLSWSNWYKYEGTAVS